MLRACIWIIFLCFGICVPSIVGNGDVSKCELLQNDQGELKVMKRKTDVQPNKDVCWHIDLTNSSDEVVLVFHNFNLLESDRVDIRNPDKNSTSPDLFGPFRGQRGVFSVFTGLSSVVVHLKTSDQKPWDRHFMAKYYTNECKYEEEVKNWGTFSSPLYGRDRVVPLQCIYVFTFFGSTSKLQKLVLSFLETNLTRGSNVQVDGSEATDGKYQGANVPYKLLSSSRLHLQFQIDPVQSQFQQFQAHYQLATASCSSVIVMNKSVSTFGVPPSLIPSEKNGVPASAQCHWILRSPNRTRIGTDLLLANSARIGSRDSLTVGDPSSFESLHLGAGTMEFGNNGYFQSSSNELWVTFTSPSIQPNLALRMQAVVHATGGYLRNSGKFFIDPPSNSVGVYMLEVPSDRRVRLLLPKTHRPALELHSDFDRSSLPFLRLLPTTPLESVVSPSNRMMLVVTIPFEASFDGVDRACHEVAQPGGCGLYTAPRSCGNYTWLLPPRSDPEELAELRFLNLDLHPGDMVTLHGLDDNPTVIATLGSGVTDPPPLHVPSRTGILMKLATRGDSSGKEIVLQFSSIFKKSCRGIYELKSGLRVDLKSPLFPDRYPLGSTCQWELQWGGPILIHLHSVRLAHPDHRLTVGGVSLPDSTRSQLTVFEGKTRVLFSAKTGAFGEDGAGFWMTATALDCGGIVRERQGKLIVPPGSLTCVWIVNATAGRPSSIVTSVFLKTTSNSRHLSVYENVDVGAPKKELIAGRELQTSRDSVLIVYNRSASSDAELLVEISFRTEECPASSICGINKCMSATWRCNGFNDCGDYKDELNCPVTNRPTTGTSSSSGSVVVTGSEEKSTSSPTTLKDSTQSVEGQHLTSSSIAGVSMMHLSLYVVAAVIVGATIPSSVYWCLLKRANGKRKTESQWTMITNGKNTENADGISL